MSKNLESEYKNFINDQIPDLWDRIEAGLGEQEPAAEEYAHVAPVTTRTPVTPARKQPAVIKRRRWIAGLAAAAACVCIIVPVALSVGNGPSMSSAALTAEATPEELNFKEAAAFEEAAEYEEAPYEEEAYEEAAAEEALYDSDMPYDAAEEAYSEEEYYTIGNESDEAAVPEASTGIVGEEASEVPEAAMAEEAYDAAGAAESASAAETEKTAETAKAAEASESSAVEESADSANEESASEESSPADTVILNSVEFKITSVSDEDIAEGRVIATIISCPDDPSLIGSAITIKALDETVALPKEPGTYTGRLSATGPDKETFLLS